MKKDSMAYVVLFTFVVCVFFVFFLALANELTVDKVAANQRFAERSAILSALGVPYGTAADVDPVYEKTVTIATVGSDELYRAEVDGQIRFAKKFAGPGLWGTISGVLAVDAAVERVSGFRIVSQLETPGLGGRIDEPWFKAQFTGEKIGDAGIKVRSGSGKGDGDRDNGELDAVTGASLTSHFVEVIVNDEIATFRKARDEGGLK